MATKGYILQMKKEIDNLIKSDHKAKRMNAEIEEVSREIREGVDNLGKLEELFEDEQERTEMNMSINLELEELNKMYKVMEKEYLDYMKGRGNRVSIFADRFPGIFEKFVKSDIDGEALLHCLDTFTMLERGDIDLEMGKEIGYHKFHKKE